MQITKRGFKTFENSFVLQQILNRFKKKKRFSILILNGSCSKITINSSIILFL